MAEIKPLITNVINVIVGTAIIGLKLIVVNPIPVMILNTNSCTIYIPNVSLDNTAIHCGVVFPAFN